MAGHSPHTNEREGPASLAGLLHAAEAGARQCMMHAGTAALIVATVVIACVWSGLLWRLWVLRHTFEIAARAPGLVGVFGVATLVVVLAILVHWTLLVEGQGLPCYVMLFTSYQFAYNTHYRLRYARYVKGAVIKKITVTAGIGIAIAAMLVFYNVPDRYARGNYGCFFFQERRATEVAVVLVLPPNIFVMFKLMQVHDVFGIGLESVRVIIPSHLGGVILIIVLELLHARKLRDSRIVHLMMDMVAFVVMSNLLIWSVLVPVSRYHGWHGAGRMFVLPVEGNTSGIDSDKEGVCDYAQEGGEIAELFGDFCRKNLCMEGWDFIMDAMAYKKLTNPHEQFTSFVRILDKYLRPTSPQEVNLGSKTQGQLENFRNENTFTSLHEVTRRTILEAAVREIVLLLEQNILTKFKLTPEMQQREERKLVELEIQSAHDVADGDEGMLELMASVSLGRMQSPKHRGSVGGMSSCK